MLLSAAKRQDYWFYSFWVIKGKTTWEEGKITAPTQIGVKRFWKRKFLQKYESP